MISLDCLLKIVLAEAIEGPDLPEDHPDIDNIIYNSMPERDPQSEPKLPPIRYPLQLIENPDGSYEWVE